MPMYSYYCNLCEHKEDHYQKMASDPITVCPKCGCDEASVGNRSNYNRVPTVPHSNLREFHTPIEMYSIGMNDDAEIRAFKQKCPDVDVCTDPASDLYGVPIARNRAQKASALSAMGFEEK
jgi:putative FmdB family regulatory protein